MTSHLQTNNKDCSKGEGPIGNEDPHEKTTTAKGSTRGLTRGDKQHWSFQNNDKQDCSKGERLIGKGKQWTLRSKDRQEKSKRVYTLNGRLGWSNEDACQGDQDV